MPGRMVKVWTTHGWDEMPIEDATFMSGAGIIEGADVAERQKWGTYFTEMQIQKREARKEPIE